MRKLVLTGGAALLGVGLAVACGSFSGEDGAAAPSDASDEASRDAAASIDGSGSNDAAPSADASVACGPYAFDGAACGNSGLDDSTNCGWCGHTCKDGQTCSNGTCGSFAVVTAENAGLILLGEDDSYVYWTNPGQPGSPIHRVELGAMNAIYEDAATVLATVEGGPGTEVMSGAIDDRIYVRATNDLYVLPLAGGPPRSFAKPSSPRSSPLASSHGHLFQAMSTGPSDGNLFDYLESDFTNRSAQVLGAYDVAATPDGRYAFVVGRDSVGGGDGGMIHLGLDAGDGGDAGDAGVSAPTSHSTLLRYDVTSGDTSPLAVVDVGHGELSLLAADDQQVYFPSADGSILSLPVNAVSGTSPTVISPGSGRQIAALAIDDTRVYWFSTTDGSHFDLMGASKCGGGDATYATEVEYLRGLSARSPTYLYYTSYVQLLRVTK